MLAFAPLGGQLSSSLAKRPPRALATKLGAQVIENAALKIFRARHK